MGKTKQSINYNKIYKISTNLESNDHHFWQSCKLLIATTARNSVQRKYRHFSHEKIYKKSLRQTEKTTIFAHPHSNSTLNKQKNLRQ